MRKVQTDPHVSLTVQPSDHVGSMDIIVENLGPGPAKNVRFSLSEDLVLDSRTNPTLSQMGLFRYGVTYLSPGQRFRFFLVSTIDHPELLAHEPVRIEIAYETVAGEKKVGEYFIDFRVLEGMWALSEPDSRKIAESLKKISTEVHAMTSGLSQLHVQTQTKAEHQQEREGIGNALQRRQESALGENAQATAAQQQDEDTSIGVPPA
jgi:hypothetical protein